MYSFKTPISINSRNNHNIYAIKNNTINNNFNSNTLKYITESEISLIYDTKS